jgi:hypothetical protein
MTDLAVAFSTLRTASTAIEQLQSAYDQVGWDIQEPAITKLTHVCLHLTIVSGRFATICERLDHESRQETTIDLKGRRELAQEIVADLIYHASQIASVFGCHISDCVIDRYRSNASRFCPNSVFAQSIPQVQR